MTPEEIARGMKAYSMRTLHQHNEHQATCPMCADLLAALAASQQRAKDADKDAWREYRAWWTGRAADELKRLGIYLTMCYPGARQEDHTVTDTALAVIAALRAQLQASEEKIKRYETPEYHVRHNCCTAVEASERALERANRVVERVKGRYHLHDGVVHAFLEMPLPHTCGLCEALAALASPGSPQEKGK